MGTENLSNSLAKYIGYSLNYSEEQISVLAYGLFGLIQTVFSIFLVLIIGLFLDLTVESLITLFSIAILRKYSGGAHATSAERCLILGSLFSILGALLSHLIFALLMPPTLYCLGVLIFVWNFYTIYKYAPVANHKKPIKSSTKRKQLKQRSILIVSIYFVINIMLFFISNLMGKSFIMYGICLTLGMSWQTFTITTLGHRIAQFLDHVLINISNTLTKEKKS